MLANKMEMETMFCQCQLAKLESLTVVFNIEFNSNENVISNLCCWTGAEYDISAKHAWSLLYFHTNFWFMWNIENYDSDKCVCVWVRTRPPVLGSKPLRVYIIVQWAWWIDVLYKCFVFCVVAYIKVKRRPCFLLLLSHLLRSSLIVFSVDHRHIVA